MDIVEFYNSLEDMKYFDNAYVKALSNKSKGLKVKIFDIERDYKLLLDLNDNKLENFLIINNLCLCIPIEFFDELYALQFKSINSKKFYNYVINDKYPLCYGFYDFFDFDFNKPIIFVEGIKDLYVIKKFYKYVIAMLTSKMNKELYNFVRYNVSKKLYMIGDNDKAGRKVLKDEKYKGFNKFFLFSKDAGEYYDKGDENILKQVEVIVNGFVKEV